MTFVCVVGAAVQLWANILEILVPTERTTSLPYLGLGQMASPDIGALLPVLLLRLLLLFFTQLHQPPM